MTWRGRSTLIFMKQKKQYQIDLQRYPEIHIDNVKVIM